jgi:hypothetical protein
MNSLEERTIEEVVTREEEEEDSPTVIPTVHNEQQQHMLINMYSIFICRQFIHMTDEAIYRHFTLHFHHLKSKLSTDPSTFLILEIPSFYILEKNVKMCLFCLMGGDLHAYSLLFFKVSEKSSLFPRKVLIIVGLHGCGFSDDGRLRFWSNQIITII